MNDPLFSSSRAALVYVFNFDGQADRPFMNKLAAPAVGSGRGLMGVDGAGQAGIIMSRLKQVGDIGAAILTARTAPRFVPCNCRTACCSGKKSGEIFINAIYTIARHTINYTGCGQKREALLVLLAQKHFGDKLLIADIAQGCGASRDTAGDLNSNMVKMLKDHERRAWLELDRLLEEAGLIGIYDIS